MDERYFRAKQPELIELLAKEVHKKAIHDITKIEGFKNTGPDFSKYEDLPEKIKEVNREWAAKYLAIVFVQRVKTVAG